MRITKKVREEAALLCAMAASSELLCVVIAQYTEASQVALKLAYAAWGFSFENTTHRRSIDWCEDWAEAESLLRCGWSPE